MVEFQKIIRSVCHCHLILHILPGFFFFNYKCVSYRDCIKEFNLIVLFSLDINFNFCLRFSIFVYNHFGVTILTPVNPLIKSRQVCLSTSKGRKRACQGTNSASFLFDYKKKKERKKFPFPDLTLI
jgi:hypothetical protein